jgi:glucose/arabinose dehydrogenase
MKIAPSSPVTRDRNRPKPRWAARGLAGLLSLTLLGCATLNSTANDAPSSPPAASPDDSSAEPEINPEMGSDAVAIADPVSVQPTTVLDGLEHPWGMVWLPDGTLLITERPGRLRAVRNGELDPTPIPGIPNLLAAGQGGLLDITIHPNFEDNRWVYIAYSDGTRDANQTLVGRAEFDGQQLTNWTVVFEVGRTKPDTQHFGARFTWLPDETLLVAIGDGGNPPVRLDGELIRNQAQNLNSRLGKIVRINADGSIPADNPFVNDANADDAIWSYGHRNIQGMAIDPVTEAVWATEHGARGGDELNWVRPGENYGWPIVTHSREYTGGEITSERSRPGMVDPSLVWTPAKAPSGLAIYRGDRIPQWQGHLFAGGLQSQEVLRIQVDEAGTVIDQEAIAIGQRVRDVREGPDGLIYVLTDAGNGRLIRLDVSN